MNADSMKCNTSLFIYVLTYLFDAFHANVVRIVSLLTVALCYLSLCECSSCIKGEMNGYIIIVVYCSYVVGGCTGSWLVLLLRRRCG